MNIPRNEYLYMKRNNAWGKRNLSSLLLYVDVVNCEFFKRRSMPQSSQLAREEQRSSKLYVGSFTTVKFPLEAEDHDRGE